SLLGTNVCLKYDVCLNISSTDRPVIKVNAMVGEAAALPCMCPPDWPPYLVWQKSIGDQALVVNYYKDDDQEDNQMALEYRNRTELRLIGNCSLVIHSVWSSDQGLYICYYKKKPLRHEKIYLEVTGQYQESICYMLLYAIFVFTCSF
uniref:Immunoglobulin V-set domain-containing protein n=1 Tax=Sinocyclocheilus grahami TaxID=75366 RepID=A0A672PDD1_SINGR